MRSSITTGVLFFVVLIASCSGDADSATTSEADPVDLATACAERAADRHEKAASTQQQIIEIVADPDAFGSEEEVLDLLGTLAAPGTQFGDDAFGGATEWRAGWRNTLYGDLDASIVTWQRWLSDDGSTGGALWTWSGTGPNGGQFELDGISLNTYDEEGLVTSQTAYYPDESSDVLDMFMATG